MPWEAIEYEREKGEFKACISKQGDGWGWYVMDSSCSRVVEPEPPEGQEYSYGMYKNFSDAKATADKGLNQAVAGKHVKCDCCEGRGHLPAAKKKKHAKEG